MIPVKVPPIVTTLGAALWGRGTWIPRHYEPQRAYAWRIKVEGINLEDATGYNGEDLEFFARNTSIPAVMQEPIRRRYSGVEYTYAGREVSPKIMRATFWDTKDLNAFHFFQRWVHLSNDQKYHGSVLPIDYQRNIIVELLEGNLRNVVETFTYKNAFPTEINEAILSYDASEAFTFDVMFAFSGRETGPKSFEREGAVWSSLA